MCDELFAHATRFEVFQSFSVAINDCKLGEKKVISYQLNITVVGRGKCFHSE